MPASDRSEVQQEVADALIESKAINFEAIGGILAKFASRAAQTGSGIHFVVGRHVTDICIPPEPYLPQVVVDGIVQERR